MRWQTAFVALRGLVYASAFVLLWAWLAVVAMRYDGVIPIAVPVILRPFGYVIGIGGAVLTACCIGSFIVRGHGTPAVFDPPREFVASGPYRYSRNPMYIGAMSVILGAGLAVGSPSIIALAVFFGLVAHVFVLLYEEPALDRQFGETYRRYRSATNRWLPRRRRDREGV